jgi:hypothetical protein
LLIAAHLLLGAAACAAFVFAARSLARRAELTIYAAGLSVAALIYVVSAFVAGATPARLAVEFAGLLAFSLVAFAGLKWSPLLLALGWAAHALWDLLLHADVHPHIVPDWYTLVCAGYDFALAAYLAALSRRTHVRARAH